MISLWSSLVYPCRSLRLLDERQPTLATVPHGVWSVLVAIAVGGSCLYGASLSRVDPEWTPIGGALWLVLSAGLAWCVFGPLLVLVAKKSAFTLAHACLVTMAYGEAVLACGALLNLVQAGISDSHWSPRMFNALWVCCANLVMATALAWQLRAIGVPAWKTLVCWIVILNGAGLSFFLFFQSLLER